MRYSRQELYKEIGKKGQKKLLKSKVAIVGIGATGTHSAAILARTGIGKLILIDRDIVELNNLQRQFLFTEKDIRCPKAKQALKHLRQINSTIKITHHNTDLTQENIHKIIPKDIDLILDCTDNMETRFLINDYSLEKNIPWIHASAIQSRAFLMNIIPKKTPCFQCIFKEPSSLETCDTAGVLNTTTSLISSLQVNEAIKILLDKNYSKNLIQINLKTNTFEKLKIKKRTNCSACKRDYRN